MIYEYMCIKLHTYTVFKIVHTQLNNSENKERILNSSFNCHMFEAAPSAYSIFNHTNGCINGSVLIKLCPVPRHEKYYSFIMNVIIEQSGFPIYVIFSAFPTYF